MGLITGVLLAGFSFSGLLIGLKALEIILWVLGGVCCFLTALYFKQPIVNKAVETQYLGLAYFKFKQLLYFWLNQGFLIVFSFVLFYFLEKQTQLNPRFSALNTGHFINIIAENPFSLGVVPFFLYSVLGIGFAYFTVFLKNRLCLTFAFPWSAFSVKKYHKLFLFLKIYTANITEVVMLTPFVFVASFMIFWMVEVVNGLFGFQSLFSVPLRTIFILGLMLFIFKNINQSLILFMQRYRMAVGAILVIYIVAFVFFVLWLHGASDWLNLEQLIPSMQYEKSYLAGRLNANAIQIRSEYLILGWFSLWIPWMASTVARLALGKSMVMTFMQTLILPGLCGFFGYFYLEDPWVGNAVFAFLGTKSGQCLVAAGVLGWMWLVWGELYTVGDVLKGAYLPIHKVSKRPLNRWMTALMLWLSAYVPGLFILGWVLMQFIVTLGSIFMLMVMLILFSVWATWLYRVWVEAKYKVPVAPQRSAPLIQK